MSLGEMAMIGHEWVGNRELCLSERWGTAALCWGRAARGSDGEVGIQPT